MNLSFDKYMNGKYKFDEIKKKIKLALVNQEYLVSEDVMNNKLCNRLFVIPTVETKDKVVVYNNKHPEDYRTIEEIFNDSLINTFEDDIKYKGIGKKIDALNFNFYEMEGKSYYLTSLMINPLFLKKFSGNNGLIFSIMSRNIYHIAPLNNFENIEVIISLFGMYVYQEYMKSKSKQILPDIFYYSNEKYINIVEYDEKGNFNIKLPDFFTKK